MTISILSGGPVAAPDPIRPDGLTSTSWSGGPWVTWRAWAALAIITAAAIALRLGYLFWQIDHTAFEWSDPDGYLGQAAQLTRSGQWRWTWDAVHYKWGALDWILPPGYPVFLSLFYRGGSSPMAAAIAQSVAGGLATVPVFLIARSLHSMRAGLIAAAISAIWFPAIAGRSFFVQEQVYMPLLLAAFAALAICIDRSLSPSRFLLAGALLGVATLTRAMPLYFLVALLPAIAWFAPSWAVGRRRAVAFFAGFVLLTAPYIVWVSLAKGHLVLIDNHMSVARSPEIGARAANLWVTFQAVVQDLFVGVPRKIEMMRGMLQVYGLSWIYHNAPARDAASAWWLGLGVRVLLDTLWVIVAILAPVGVVLARRRDLAALFVVWTLFVVVSSVLLGFSGARYRVPFEFVFITAAAVVLGGRWRWPGTMVAAIGGVVAIAIATVVLPQYSRSVTAHVPYGVGSATRIAGFEGVEIRGRGPTGFYALPTPALVLTVEIEPVDEARMEFGVSVDGHAISTVPAERGAPARVRVPVRHQGPAFVELSPTSPATTVPPQYLIRAVQ